MFTSLLFYCIKCKGKTMFKTVQKLLIKFFNDCHERNCLHNSIKLPDLQFTFLRLFRLLTYICADIVVFLHSGQVLNSDIILLHQSESHFLERKFKFQTKKIGQFYYFPVTTKALIAPNCELSM